MLPVDRAGVGGDHDCRGHYVVIDHVEGAVCLLFVPGPGVVEGDGEERRVVLWRLFAGGFVAVITGCWRKRKCGVNGSPDVAAAGVAVAVVDRGGRVSALFGGEVKLCRLFGYRTGVTQDREDAIS